jgi:hypothetical protein
VQVTVADVSQVPSDHLHVGRDQFAAVWAAAETHHDEQVSREVADWYAYGVVATCRWVATVTVRPERGPWHLPRSPVTERTKPATPELIEAECLAAQVLAMTRPVPGWLESRPGWVEAIVATFDWAWRGNGLPPVTVEAVTVKGRT